jgi:hypothetical protein
MLKDKTYLVHHLRNLGMVYPYPYNTNYHEGLNAIFMMLH